MEYQAVPPNVLIYLYAPEFFSISFTARYPLQRLIASTTQVLRRQLYFFLKYRHGSENGRVVLILIITTACFMMDLPPVSSSYNPSFRY
jgi:hypothetical protein